MFTNWPLEKGWFLVFVDAWECLQPSCKYIRSGDLQRCPSRGPIWLSHRTDGKNHTPPRCKTNTLLFKPLLVGFSITSTQVIPNWHSRYSSQLYMLYSASPSRPNVVSVWGSCRWVSSFLPSFPFLTYPPTQPENRQDVESYRLNCVPPKFICWSSNPQYLWLWLYVEMRFLIDVIYCDQVTRLCPDWRPYKKEKFGHRDTHTGKAL